MQFVVQFPLAIFIPGRRGAILGEWPTDVLFDTPKPAPGAN